MKIIPASYAESAGTTETLAAYLATSSTWKLGVAQALAWPRCVQHVSGEPAMVAAVSQTAGAIRWAARRAGTRALLRVPGLTGT